MDLFFTVAILAVLLFFLVVDMVGNRLGRSFPPHKLTHHRR